ncbi:MAG: mechanosensitive ion channel [Sedimentisphaerales bacterium]|nr:mechanosensitive ion channel [Sedimentisphaerales bacterium]
MISGTSLIFAQAESAWMENIVDYITTNGLEACKNLALAIVIFWLGRIVARLLSGVLAKVLRKSKLDETLVVFAKNVSFAVLMVVVVVAALGRMGIETGSVVAVIGAAGLAVGLALQGSLANFAAGVLLIMFRPFKVDDVISVGGVVGKVVDIDIFTTSINTPDNARIVLPNASITGSNITNFSKNSTRRVDMVMSISYGDNIKKAKETIETVLKSEPRVLAEPAYTVAVGELGESSVDILVRPWVNSADYWDVKFALTERLKEALESNGMTIPFPQRDVYIKTDSDNQKSVI